MIKKKIAHIASRELNYIGGIETYVRNLYPLLIKKGYFPILYIQSEKWKTEIHDDHEKIYIKSLKNKFFGKIFTGFIATLHVLLFKRNIMVIHYHAMAAGLFSFLPRLFGYKVVFQGHGIEWQRAKWSGFFRKIIKLLDYLVLKVNNNIVMVSEDQTLHLREWMNKRSTVVTPGVNIDRTHDDEKILDSLNLKKDKYILFLGRLVEEKRPDLLIDAFQELDKDSGVALILVGDGESKYIKRLKDRAFESNIFFLGPQYGNKKNVLIKNAKLFCIPSDLEGLPITLLEAMSFGKLCVASSIPANVEALSDTGVFFEQGNIMDLKSKLQFVLNGGVENSLGEGAKKRTQSVFTWNSVADKFIKIYEN